MSKLGNIFEGDVFKITQTGHEFDNAIDCVGPTFNILAPCDLKVGKQLYDHQAKTPYFEAWNNNFMLRFVHSQVKRTGIQAKGVTIGSYDVNNDPFPNHVHIALNLGGKWVNFMEYLDRRLKLRLGAGFGSDRQAGRWSYWGDRELDIIKLVKPTPIPPAGTQYYPKEDLIQVKKTLEQGSDFLQEGIKQLDKVIVKL